MRPVIVHHVAQKSVPPVFGRYVSGARNGYGCPIHAWCTKARFRMATRHDPEDDRARTVPSGQRCRRINEHLNRVAKRDHGRQRAARRGPDDMRIHAALPAAVINLT